MIISSFILTVLYLALARARSFLFLLAVRSLLGMFKHTQSNMKIIGGDVCKGVHRTQFISTINSMSGFAFMIGPLITAELPKQSCFYISSTLCGLCFLAISNVTFWYIPETLNKTPKEETAAPDQQSTDTVTPTPAATVVTPPPGPPATFLQQLSKYKKLRVVFLFRFFAALSVVIIRYFIPLYTMHYLGFNIRNNSHMTSFVGFTGVVCANAAGHISQWVPDKRKLTLYSSVLLCCAVSSSLFATRIELLMLTQFALSLATQNLRVVIDSIILSSVGDKDRGEVFGVGATVVSMCRVGGPILAGVLGDVHMIAPLVCSLGFAVAATGVWWFGADPDKDIKTE
eukprot:sb/3466372/